MKTLILLASLGLVPGAQAEILRGRITAPGGKTVEYVYESASNSFGLDLEPLATFRVLSQEVTPAPKPWCKTWRDMIGPDNSLRAADFDSFQAPGPLRVRFEVMQAYKDPVFAGLVQEDLRDRGKIVSLPRNATYFQRNLFRAGLRWNERSISVSGGTDLVANAEAAFRSALTLDTAEDGRVTGVLEVPRARAYFLCDLEDRKVSIEVEHEFKNGFLYFEHGKVTPGVLKSLARGVSARGSTIEAAASNAQMLSGHEARLVAAGSLLTVEIGRMPNKAELLKPDTFLRLFERMYVVNPSAIQPRADLRDGEAEEIADRMGKPVDTEITKIEGKKTL